MWNIDVLSLSFSLSPPCTTCICIHLLWSWKNVYGLIIMIDFLVDFPFIVSRQHQQKTWATHHMARHQEATLPQAGDTHSRGDTHRGVDFLKPPEQGYDLFFDSWAFLWFSFSCFVPLNGWSQVIVVCIYWLHTTKLMIKKNNNNMHYYEGVHKIKFVGKKVVFAPYSYIVEK